MTISYSWLLILLVLMILKSEGVHVPVHGLHYRGRHSGGWGTIFRFPKSNSGDDVTMTIERITLCLQLRNWLFLRSFSQCEFNNFHNTVWWCPCAKLSRGTAKKHEQCSSIPLIEWPCSKNIEGNFKLLPLRNSFRKYFTTSFITFDAS